MADDTTTQDHIVRRAREIVAVRPFLSPRDRSVDIAMVTRGFVIQTERLAEVKAEQVATERNLDDALAEVKRLKGAEAYEVQALRDEADRLRAERDHLADLAMRLADTALDLALDTTAAPTVDVLDQEVQVPIPEEDAEPITYTVRELISAFGGQYRNLRRMQSQRTAALRALDPGTFDS